MENNSELENDSDKELENDSDKKAEEGQKAQSPNTSNAQEPESTASPNSLTSENEQREASENGQGEKSTSDTDEANAVDPTAIKADIDKSDEKQAEKKSAVKSAKKKTPFAKKNSAFSTVLLGVLLVFGLLMLAERFPARLDLTSDGVYTLSDTSQTLVQDLKEPLRITVFLSRNLPPPFNNLEVTVRDLLEEYDQFADQNYNYVILDVTEKEADENPEIAANLQLAKDYGISAQKVQTVEKDEIKVVNAYMSMVIEYGDLIEKINVIDSSASLEYRISSLLDRINTKVNKLLSLDTAIKATLYLPTNFVEISPLFGVNNLDTLEKIVTEQVEESQKKNYGKLEYVVASSPISESEASRLGLIAFPWDDFSSGGIRYNAGIGTAALHLELNGQSRVIELLNSTRSLQISASGGLQEAMTYSLYDERTINEFLDGAIEDLLDINRKLAYFTGAAGVEIEPPPRRGGNIFQQQPRARGYNFSTLLEQRYRLNQVDADGIVENYDLLIIPGPTEPLNDYQLFQIDQFLMKGGSLIVFYDMFIEKQDPYAAFSQQASIPEWVENPAGLEKLLAAYGVNIKNEVIMDEKAFISRQANAAGTTTEVPAYFAPIIQNDKVNENFTALNNVRNFIFLAGSPVDVDQQLLEKNGASATLLFSSSDKSWTQTENISLIPFLSDKPEDTSSFRSYKMAYALEGSFESYFKGKPVPKKPLPEEGQDPETQRENAQKAPTASLGETAKEVIERSLKPAKIVVLPSSHMIRNNMIDASGQAPNSMLVQNLIDYGIGQEDWAVMRSKSQRINPLNEYDPESGFLVGLLTNPRSVKFTNMVLWPSLIALLGFVFWNRRRRHRASLEKMSLTT